MSGKNWTWLALSTLAAVLWLAISAVAQEAPQVRQDRPAAGARLMEIAIPPAFLETLSAEQREKITVLQQKAREQMLAIRTETLKGISAVLTPEQRVEFERIQAEIRERAAQRMRERQTRTEGGEQPRREGQ